MRYYLGTPPALIKINQTSNLPLRVESEKASPTPSAQAPFHPSIMRGSASSSASSADTGTDNSPTSNSLTAPTGASSTDVGDSSNSDAATSTDATSTTATTPAPASSTSTTPYVWLGAAAIVGYLLLK